MWRSFCQRPPMTAASRSGCQTTGISSFPTRHWRDSKRRPILAILDTQDGSIVRLTTTVGDGLYAPSVSADGSRLVATRLHYFQEIWKVPLGSDPDTNGRTAVRLIGESAGPLWTFVSRDGRTVLFNSPASGSRNLWTAPPDPGAHLSQITTVPGDAISHSSLSPDGTRVAFASIAAGHSDIWTQRVDGSDLRQLTNDEPADSWPVWSPDDEWIVYQSYRADRQETWRIRASGGLPEKLLDQGFRGDWIRQPGGNGTWIVTTGSSTAAECDSSMWNAVRWFGIRRFQAMVFRCLFSDPMDKRLAHRFAKTAFTMSFGSSTRPQALHESPLGCRFTSLSGRVGPTRDTRSSSTGTMRSATLSCSITSG